MHHAVGDKFALGRKLLRQTVEDEIEVQFPRDGDVKSRHAQVWLETCRRPARLHG